MTHFFSCLWIALFNVLGCGYESSTLLDEPGHDSGPDAGRDLPRDAGPLADARADGGPPDAGPRETVLTRELACRLDHDAVLAAAARAVACRPGEPGSMRSYFEGWEIGLFGNPAFYFGITGFEYEWGCEAWRCIASATSCDAFDACLTDTVRGGPCEWGAKRCAGDVLEVCRRDRSGYSQAFDCRTLDASCDPERACVISETCSFGRYDYEGPECVDGDVALCGGEVRASCDAWAPGSSCNGFGISGELPAYWCSPTGEGSFGAYAESEVTCTAGTVTFTSATSVSATYDCLAAGYSGCDARGCVP